MYGHVCNCLIHRHIVIYNILYAYDLIRTKIKNCLPLSGKTQNVSCLQWETHYHVIALTCIAISGVLLQGINSWIFERCSERLPHVSVIRLSIWLWQDLGRIFNTLRLRPNTMDSLGMYIFICSIHSNKNCVVMFVKFSVWLCVCVVYNSTSLSQTTLPPSVIRQGIT